MLKSRFNLHRSLQLLLLTASLLLAGTALAINPDELLDYDEAFSPTVTVLDDNTLGITFTIQPKYYMYRRFLAASSDLPEIELATPEPSPGVTKFDDLLGEEVETWGQKMVMTIAITKRPATATQFTLKLRSQGCLESVLCYPPTVQQLTVQLPAIAAPIKQALTTPSGLGGLLGQSNSFAGAKGAALQPDQAFVFEALALDDKQLLLRFTPEPGYYLYKDMFKFRLESAGDINIISSQLPTGKIKDDPEFGMVEVYFDQVEVPVKLSRPVGPATPLIITADFQGCRDGDICYPPMQRSLSVELPAATTASVADIANPLADNTTTAPAVAEHDKLAQLLLDHPWRAMLAFLGLGLLLAFTPCVFPMVPILSGIIAGEGDKITTRRAFVLSLVYVLAMALTYTVVGVLAGLFGKNLQAVFQNPWILSSFAGVFVLLSLSMFGFYELQLPARLQTKLSEMSNRQEGGKLAGVAIMGLLSALIVGPCVAPPLAAAIIVIGNSGDPLLGGGALFAMSMGMGIPLIIIGTTAGKLLPRAGAWMDAVKAVFGIGLLGMAIWMLERILPGGVIMFLWGSLLLASGIYLGALEPLTRPISGWQKLWKSLGVILLLIGSLQLIGALAGGDDWSRPLASFKGSGSAQEETSHLQFRPIKTIADINAAILQANAQGKTVMLDFYADWCIECKRMERNTFSDAAVQAALNNTVLLQADVTAYDATDEALIKHYGLIGPPAILFFDLKGNEIKNYRMVGYMSASDFLAHTNAALDQR
ncbi:MAG: protein-disulfide reductase DsbD [Xanthomonadales bacterium]|nr:protein-disulfide reductase DsbD [Xanthomonadales bacterium]